MCSASTTRRRYLAALVGLGALGGCSGASSQSFEASAVVLPPEDRTELRLAETGRDARTTSRDGPSGNVEITVTNETAVYSHAAGYGGS